MTNQERLAKKYAEAIEKAQEIKRQMVAEAREAKKNHKMEEEILMLQIKHALGEGFLNALENQEITLEWLYLADKILNKVEECDRQQKAGKIKSTLTAETAARWKEIRTNWENRILATARAK